MLAYACLYAPSAHAVMIVRVGIRKRGLRASPSSRSIEKGTAVDKLKVGLGFVGRIMSATLGLADRGRSTVEEEVPIHEDSEADLEVCARMLKDVVGWFEYMIPDWSGGCYELCNLGHPIGTEPCILIVHRVASEREKEPLEAIESSFPVRHADFPAAIAWVSDGNWLHITHGQLLTPLRCVRTEHQGQGLGVG